ncbi:hypothetical protein QM012_006973 [Aureobasidium pullulans]|uniref:2EXR domain-containing protein n=1 Tax=Aureobasidium pullulans TaxID=5580 RepID=A0ABR0TQ45_AURPU
MVLRLPFKAPPSHLPQHIPPHRTLIPPTDLYYQSRWVAQREMDAGRPKRLRASINYIEPTELDEDIAEYETLDKSSVVAASNDPPTDTEDLTSVQSDSDSGSDQEFTTDKRKLRAQQKKRLAKKGKKVKKIKEVPFRFMDLPPEIRIMIYKACLVEPANNLSYANKTSGYDIVRGSLKRSTNRWGAWVYRLERDRWDTNRTALQPVILRINKAIRDEALPYLYAQPFYFTTTHTFQLFFARISPANRMLLRDVFIDGWTDTKHARVKDAQIIFSLLMSATNIRSLRLGCRPASPTDGTRGHTSKFSYDFWHDIEYWADAMDAAHGKGAAKAALSFTKSCFASPREIENEDEEIEKREKNFWASLRFTKTEE